MAQTRLAPSPTGALHLGNARTFLINWLLARKGGWKIALRIEDIDGPRIKPHASGQLMEDLAWLGIDWDSGPIYQSRQPAVYRQAIEKLIAGGYVYPCVCSRKEIDLAASAPHAEDGSTVYPGTCRGKFASVEEAKKVSGKEPALRFSVGSRIIEFSDEFRGAQKFDVAKQLGDFVVAKSDGTPAYQLAVVVDDIAAGVDQIVRGDDLLDSTPRQILLYEALGAKGPIPHYTHLPLVVGSDGRRLAKRHGDTRIVSYRNAGTSHGQMLALLARWCGLDNGGKSIDDPRRLIDSFRLDQVSRQNIVFTPADDAALRPEK
jgi:glutamyl-tRNA synthetase